MVRQETSIASRGQPQPRPEVGAFLLISARPAAKHDGPGLATSTAEARRDHDQRRRLALGSVEGAAPNTDEGQRKPPELLPGLRTD